MPATPDYIRIADEIMSDVQSGQRKPGEKLPTMPSSALPTG